MPLDSNWWTTLTREQIDACKAIMFANGKSRDHGGGDWFYVFMYPTCRTPTYLEVRKRDNNGRILRRWVVTDD